MSRPLDSRVPLPVVVVPRPPQPRTYVLNSEMVELLKVLVDLNDWIEVHSDEAVARVPERLRRSQQWGMLSTRGLAEVERHKTSRDHATVHYRASALGRDWYAGLTTVPRSITMLDRKLWAISENDLIYVHEVGLDVPQQAASESEEPGFLDSLLDV